MNKLVPWAFIGGGAVALYYALRPSNSSASTQPSTSESYSESLVDKPKRKVAHIGDSLTSAVVPGFREAYKKAGADASIDAFGGRAVLQKYPKDPRTGIEAVEKLKSEGFEGDWVVALGTNDTAFVATGASYTRDDAIDAMMNAIDPGKKARVMWVNTRTAKTTGPWSVQNMVLWNLALEKAKLRWPNLVVYDWFTESGNKQPPYVDDIHHTPDGYVIRVNSIVDAYKRLLP